MAQSSTLAQPYAKAAFEFALENHALKEWHDFIIKMADLLADPQLQKLLGNPLLEQDRIAETIIAEAKRIDDQQQNFLRLLASNKRLSLLPTISAEFNKQLIEYQKAIEVTVVAALPLTEQQQQAFINSLKNRFKREINLKHTVDPTILGGAIVYANDLVIDGSVTGKLARLNKSLMEGNVLCN